MIFALILIIVGVAIGLVLPIQSYAISSSFYTSVGILAVIDSIIGAIKASYEEEFDTAIFASGLFLNTLLAVALSWVGDKIGVPLYFAAVFVFGTRLFNNLALIRRRVIERFRAGMAFKREMQKKRSESEDRSLENDVDSASDGNGASDSRENLDKNANDSGADNSEMHVSTVPHSDASGSGEPDSKEFDSEGPGSSQLEFDSLTSAISSSGKSDSAPSS